MADFKIVKAPKKYWRLTVIYPDGNKARLVDYDLFYMLFYVQCLQHNGCRFKLEKR